MMVNRSELRSGGGHVSLKVKFLLIYVGMVMMVLFIISMLLPVILNRYLIAQKVKELDDVKEIVSQVLQEEDFRADPNARKILTAAANASGICIWVASPVDSRNVQISVFGYLGDDINGTDFASFTAQEKTYVKDVMEGAQMYLSRSVFPTAFSKETISVGYSQNYLTLSQVKIGPLVESMSGMETGAVFLHIAADDLYVTSRTLQLITFIMMLVLAGACILVSGILANNVFLPVSRLQHAAEAVTKGDFSQKVDVRTNDEIGELTTAFNNMTSQLQSVDTLQSDFIANISHDFRSPLTSIKGYVEAMLDGTIPPEMYEKYLRIVLDESNRLTKMTNNVLDLTKMENGQYEINRVRFDINEMIIKLALSLEQRIEEKYIAINFQFLQEKLYVYADIDLMERVVYNLLDNALKFTEAGDKITVETSIVAKKAYIVVSDTGSGIDESSLPHIFDRFNKGDKSRGKNKMGTGLGLAIVKQIMLNHHEDIKVYSKPGEGTRFSFTLPLAGKGDV
ncbi:MAG: HAMP domain-containing histidine kinase [Lachnospiraceae bacterium]|nr:HAMP domain-containing histidine kinase [Lachnospiraceae bacterium]